MSFFQKILNSKLLIIFTFCVLLFSVTSVNYPSVFFLDDMSVGFSAPYDWKNFWKVPDHGSYVSNIPIKLFGFYLADWFHIHPQDFINSFGVYLRCFLFMLIPLLTVSFGYINRKKDGYYSLILILLYLLMFNSLRFSMVELLMTTAFYRLTFPFVFWLIFWSYFYKHYSANNITPKFLIISSILALILGNSSELFAIVSVFTFIFIFFGEILTSDGDSFAEKIKNIRLKFFIPFIFLFCGLLILLINPGYLLQIKIKHERFPYITIWNTLPLFFDFLKEYYHFIFVKHIIPLIIIISEILILGFTELRQDNKKLLIFEISSFLSILLFYFVLFFAGRTHYSGEFWIQHNDLQFIIHVFFIILAFIPFLNITDYCKKKIISNSILLFAKIIFSFVLTLSLFLNLIYYLNFTDKYKSKLSYIRENMYLYEKFTSFYWAKNQKAIVPYNCDFDNMLGYIVFDTIYREFDFSADDDMFSDYMNTLYPNFSDYGYYYVYPEKALLIYMQNGGIVTEEEIKKLKFGDINKN